MVPPTAAAPNSNFVLTLCMLWKWVCAGLTYPTSDGQKRPQRCSTPQHTKALRQCSLTFWHGAKKDPESDCNKHGLMNLRYNIVLQLRCLQARLPASRSSICALNARANRVTVHQAQKWEVAGAKVLCNRLIEGLWASAAAMKRSAKESSGPSDDIWEAIQGASQWRILVRWLGAGREKHGSHGKLAPVCQLCLPYCHCGGGSRRCS